MVGGVGKRPFWQWTAKKAQKIDFFDRFFDFFAKKRG
jgi:hypothetical protein